MTKLSEDAIEKYAIKLFKRLGYTHHYGPDIALEGDTPMRSRFENVLLDNVLREAIARINPDLPQEAQEDVVREVDRLPTSQNLRENNKAFHDMLTEGVRVSIRKRGEERGRIAQLIDFDTLENNRFHIVNQFSVTGHNSTRRPDIVLFVNGIPIVVIELKNPADENATVEGAYRQLQTYMDQIPALFAYNGFLVISDALDSLAGTISASFQQFRKWKKSDADKEEAYLIPEIGTLINKMLTPSVLLDIIQNFILFEDESIQDKKTKIMQKRAVKKIAAYHQYHAVNKIIDSVVTAACRPGGDRKGGVVWHTQGSGKSLTMLFAVGKMVRAAELKNPTIVIITDRNDLDDQLFATFPAGKQLLRQTPVHAETRAELRKILQVAVGGVVFTTIQKLQTEDGDTHDVLTERENVIVIADEAHRTQYGLGLREKIIKNKKGKAIKEALSLLNWRRKSNCAWVGKSKSPQM